ncbi:MAG TPA: hypothetical protein VHC43_08895 [Mycobacteriales bacterium]|nr:hypothetical protein [Mycobacteriales bacterium]
MSAEHVEAMNALLVDATGVRAACRRLPRPYVIAYRLSDGPGGQDVHWTVAFDDTVRFGLTQHPQPDVVIVGAWREMVLASAASRTGQAREPEVRYEGDDQALVVTAPVLEEARAVATVPVEFPDL